MDLQQFELANIFIAIGVLAILRYKRDNCALVFSCFVYATFHFSFGALALLSPDSGRILITMHSEGAGYVALTTGIIVLSAIFGIAILRFYRSILDGVYARNNFPVVSLAFTMAALLIGYLQNYREGDLDQAKNVLSILAMLLLCLLATSKPSSCVNIGQRYSTFIVSITAIVTAVAFYEVVSKLSWSANLYAEGAWIYRASSVLFNPNLLGYWASLVYLYCIHTWSTQDGHKHKTLWMFSAILAATALYLSGSRSSAFLLLAVSFIPVVLLRNLNSTAPTSILTLTIGAIYLTSSLFSEGKNTINALGERFIATPWHFVNYTIGKDTPPEIAESIEGRFVGGIPDSGWVVLYQDTGWIGLVACLLACSLLIINILRAWWINPTPEGAFALSAVLYGLLSGLVIRFQVFPVWLFAGIIIIFGIACSQSNKSSAKSIAN